MPTIGLTVTQVIVTTIDVQTPVAAAAAAAMNIEAAVVVVAIDK